MSDYISRKAAEERLNRLERESHHNSVLWPDHVEECREAIREIPAADVRPVVLCRDCVHFTSYSVINEDGTGTCGLCGKRPIGFIVDEYDFCSSGERRKGGADNGN